MRIKKKVSLQYIKLKFKFDYISITTYYSNFKAYKNWDKLINNDTYEFTYNFENAWGDAFVIHMDVVKKDNMLTFIIGHIQFQFIFDEVKKDLIELVNWLKQVKKLKK